MARKQIYLLIVVVAPFGLTLITTDLSVGTLEKTLFSSVTIFLGVAITLYALTSTTVVPILTTYTRKIRTPVLPPEVIAKKFKSMLHEMFQGIIGILAVFLFTFFGPLIKGAFGVLLAKWPLDIVFCLKQLYAYALYAGACVVFIVIWDMVVALRKLNELHMVIFERSSSDTEQVSTPEV